MLQFYIALAVTIIAGLLAAAPAILGKSTGSGGLIGKLKPFEAIIGLVALAIAVWGLIGILGALGAVFSSLRGIADLISTVSLLGVGFLLSMPILGPALGQGGANLAAKLNPYKILMGLICLAAAALAIISLIV
jgi:hypothetical protein